ncbi:MAG: 4Fe-4S dicluster domain-containing protein [Elusimicrobia bacterium]|nr:4Fe-4S dicluster domain-containing protein [Elusimicrobiota bacterium]
MAAPMNPARRAALVKGASKAKTKARIDLAGCTGCEVCISACPVESCIEPFGDDINTRGVYVNYDLCIGCTKCVKDCPWDTIKMVPTASVEGHTTSLESAQLHLSPIFEHINLLDERVKKPLAEKGIGLDTGLPSR